MPLNIKNIEVEILAGQVATLARETKTEAVKQALIERLARLRARGSAQGGRKSLRDYLERNVWSRMPATKMGRVLSRQEEDHILGYGPEGY